MIYDIIKQSREVLHMNKELKNLNDYTLINKNANVIDIYFYPAHSITKTKVNKIEGELCIRFLIERREDGLCDMHCSLLIEYDEELYTSYNLLSKEIDTNKFAFVYDADAANDAEVLPKGIIDFNILDYDYFLSVLKTNEDLKKIVPYMAEYLHENITTVQALQESIEHLEVLGPSSFFQNTTAYFVDRIEELMTKKEDTDLRTKVLENISKNFELVFVKDKVQINLAYLNLIAIIIKNIKSEFIKPICYLEAKELKCDTNKEKIDYAELTDVLDNIQEDYANVEKKEISMVNERVKYFIMSKPYIKEFKNYLKIVFANSKYISEGAKFRSVKEEDLKELFLDSLSSFNYLSLQRNQVLLYHMDETDCDFMCVASIDFIFSVLQTYRLNSQVENQVYIKDYKTLIDLYRKNEQTNQKELMRVYILLILMINIYYYKNMGSLNLFNKGRYILKLEFNKGAYDIQAINHDTQESIGQLQRLAPETKDAIELALKKNEHTFNELVNGILLDNIEENISLGTVKTDIHSLSHKDIVIYLTKNRKNDIFDLTLTLDELLLLLTEFKPVADYKVKRNIETPEQDPDEITVIKHNKSNDRAFVLRKADTIYNIMEVNEIDSDEYHRIAKLYKEYLNTSDKKEKDAIVKELKELIL